METGIAETELEGIPELPGIEHRMVEAGGVRIHVAESGSGDPVLLLHGWPQHWYMWHEVMARLAPHLRLIAPDLRGFGWSEAPGHGYDAETFADDQVALLDALGIDRVKLIGHDWGGWTSFLLGIDRPERIERMVVLNAPHPWPQPGLRLLPDAWRSWYAAVNATPFVGAAAHRTAGWAAGILRRAAVATPFEEDAIETYVAQFRDRDRARAASSLYRYYFSVFLRGLRGGYRRSRLSVPTLLLFAEGDIYVTRKLIGENWREHADDMRVEMVPDCGHFIVDEMPELVAERALEFLR